MEKLMSLGVGLLRYVLPVLAVMILFTCIISLFRNRPRLHRLAQLVDQSNGSIVDIDRWEISIGRSKSNDITLPVAGVARFHAVIAKKKNCWTVTDTFSKNGVFVNGKKIEERCEIDDGDIITIGSINFKFLCAEAVSTRARSEMRKMASDFNQAQTDNIAYAVLVDAKTHRPLYIRKKDVLIGRGNDADIQIVLDTISSHHARIHFTSRGWALSDLNSHNGTKLNGRFITQPQLIFDEDIITFGDRVFVFYDK